MTSTPEESASLDRFRGALLGLAVGDAVGTTVEFMAPGTFEPVTDMVGGGPFNLPAGAWTDDTSMALCLAESLIERREFDPIDQLERYRRWYRDGYLSSTGSYFDIRGATRIAIERFERTGEAYPGDHAETAAGNGPLMKLAPIAMAYAAHPEYAFEFAARSARTTHGAMEALDAAQYFASLLVKALNGAPVAELLEPWSPEDDPLRMPVVVLCEEVGRLAMGSFLRAEPPEIKAGGYVIRALEAALWALRTTNSFEAGVLAAANLGDDADTTAAIYGQLAGAAYGARAIPQGWLDKLVLRERIVQLADDLHALSRSIDPARIVRVPAPDAPLEVIREFAGRFSGFRYLGRDAGARNRAVREAYLREGTLPDEIDELRAYLSVQCRRERARDTPTPDDIRYRSALLTRLEGLVRAGD